ncbi:MAG: GNAT family N-acetyltransferase [Acutalibacter sp.]|nr:GNAT family N-acetyltransferase [Acutalibacter sp.]
MWDWNKENKEKYRGYRYETASFALRQVVPEDAPALLRCYGDAEAVALMNGDNCSRGFYCATLADMESYIRIWQGEGYARPAVIDKQTGEVIGTLEIFGGEAGVLRVDLRRDYEREDVLRELYTLALREFTRDFPMGALVTKAPPAAKARRKVLEALGFAGPEAFRGYPDYYRMPVSPMRRELRIAYCGLACCLCSENASCPGCREEGCENRGTCQNYQCCREKGFSGCWQCPEFPCGAPMLEKARVRAFARFAWEHGEEALLDCLENGERAGLVYHREGLTGDYDLGTEEEVLGLLSGLLEKGKESPAGQQTVEELIEAVYELNQVSGMDSGVYAAEECAELIKELMKEQRGKGSRESLVEEACDVLLTTAILLKKHGVEKDEIENRIRFKASKALERWQDSGEV